MKLKKFRQQGFTLVEMATVLVILGFVLGALLLPLQAQRQQIAQAQTENTLENAKRALLGFAQSRGRLPCPATAASNGLEAPLGGNVLCTSQLGYMPAATLGIQPTDADGFVVDAWNNRIMYAVAQNSTTTIPANTATPDYTTSNATDGMDIVGLANLTPELRICNSSIGVTATTCSGGTESNYLINNAVAVIYSLGETGAQASGGVDENVNPNIPSLPATFKSVFVSHGIVAGSVNEFDHIVTWISPFVLYNAMIEAGQLH